MGLIINNYNKESISFASKIHLSVDKKEYSINLDKFDYINVSNKKHKVKILKGRLKNSYKTLDFSNGETYIVKYYCGLFKSKVEYKKIDILRDFQIDKNIYGLFILDKHNRKIWLPVISNYMVLKYKDIFTFELRKHEEEEHINLKSAIVGYAFFGTAGAVLGGMNTNETNKYEILITLNNAQKILIENLDKKVAQEILEAFKEFEIEELNNGKEV